MLISRAKRTGLNLGFLFTLIALVFSYYYFIREQGPIYNFNAARDTQEILDIFDKNWYWLIANDDTSPAFLFKYRTPNENPLYFGKMNIKVLRENDHLAGFVTYYKVRGQEWQLLFVAVSNEFRGKGYGVEMTRYALNDMIAQGAKRIWLCTRLANLPAQRIYKELGFVEFMHTPGGYVYFEYIV